MSDERVALVTGANRGIGLEVARRLVDHGLRVVLGSRDEERGREAAAGLGELAVAQQLDVTDPESVRRAVAAVDERLGRLDVLVNNAGIYSDANESGTDPDFDKFEDNLRVNLVGAWRAAAATIPLMLRGSYGRIVNVSSGAGQLSDMSGGAPGYRASKAGMNVMTRVLADELRGSGILINSACPGWVRTDMGGQSAPRSIEEGADTPVWLATLPDDGPSGGFFRNRDPIPW